MVTGQIDWAVLDQLTTVWLTAHGHGHTGSPPDDHPAGPRKATRTGRGKPPGRAAGRPRGRAAGRPGGRQAGKPRREPASRPHRPPPGPTATSRSPAPATATAPAPARSPPPRTTGLRDRRGCLEATRRRLQATILRWSLDLLSGPGGLASQLRGTLLGAPFNTLSQPLDIGRTTRTIPPHLRTAVIQRDQHCQFPRCTQPPSVCDVHHLIPVGQRRPHQPG